MFLKTNKRKVVWLIDGGYVLKAHNGKIDYNVLREELELKFVGGVFFDQCIFYNSTSSTSNATNFYDGMLKNGFDLKLYPTKCMTLDCFCCKKQTRRKVQKGVDVGIATDLLKMGYTDMYDKVVITTGDGDFLDAVLSVQDIGKEVCIAGYEHSMSRDLIDHCSDIYYIQ